jgi:hypothetical protein
MISDYIKIKLAALPGIAEATSHLEGGKQIIRINGETAIVGPFASDNEVEVGIRLALGIPEQIIAPEGIGHDPMTPSHITLVPAVNITEPKPMANLTGGNYQPGSLKTLLQGLKDRHAAVMGTAVAEATQAHKALDHVESITRDMSQTTSGILSELGQFTNMPDDDETKA